MRKKTQRTAQHIRLDAIRALLKDNREVSVVSMAHDFGVSEMTIHRDLQKLVQDGHIRRTRGGAMPTEKMEFEFDFALRRSSNRKAKMAIAARAVELIRPGQSLILDTGTTTLELAYLLKDREDLRVITPSLAVASVLYFSTGIETVLLGGSIRRGSPDLTGVLTENMLDLFMVDIAFQGADGISLDGELFNSDTRIAHVDRKMRQRSRKTYILCDSSKIGKTELASNGSLPEINALITDSQINPEHLKALRKLNTRIITVSI